MRYPESDGLIKARLLLVDSALLNPTAMMRMDFIRHHGLQGCGQAIGSGFAHVQHRTDVLRLGQKGQITHGHARAVNRAVGWRRDKPGIAPILRIARVARQRQIPDPQILGPAGPGPEVTA